MMSIWGDFVDEEEELNARRDFMMREGYSYCNIPACNCNSWHKRDAFATTNTEDKGPRPEDVVALLLYDKLFDRVFERQHDLITELVRNIAKAALSHGVTLEEMAGED